MKAFVAGLLLISTAVLGSSGFSGGIAKAGPAENSLLIEALDGQHDYLYLPARTEGSALHPAIACQQWRGKFLKVKAAAEYEIIASVLPQDALISSRSCSSAVPGKEKSGFSCALLKTSGAVTKPAGECSDRSAYLCLVRASDREENQKGPLPVHGLIFPEQESSEKYEELGSEEIVSK